MLKICWKSLIIGFLTIAVSIVVFRYFMSSDETQAQYTEYFVERGNITESISASGQAELVDEQKLRFNQTGKVTGVFFSDGDEVKKGDIIAELDKSQLEGDIKQAEINLQNAQISLDKLLEGSTKSEILQAQNSVSDLKARISIAETNLEIARNNYTVTLENLDIELDLAEKDVAEKEKDLEIAQTSFNNSIIYKEADDQSAVTTYNSTLVSAMADIQAFLTDMEDTLIEIDNVLGVSDERKNVNNDFEYYLGAKDHTIKTLATSQMKNVMESFEVLEQSYDDLYSQDSVDKEDIMDMTDSLSDFLDTAIIAFENYYSTLENSISSGDDSFSESQISSLKSAALGYVKTANSELEVMQSINDNLSTLESPEITWLRNEESYIQKETAVSSAELSLEKSENTLSTLKQTIDSDKESARLELVNAENDLENLKVDLEIAEENLDDVLEGSDEDDIEKARNEVILKELSLENVKSDTDKYEIIAPFDGVVRQIDYKVGDNILSDDDKYIYIENPELLSIDILLDQIDIVQIEEGQKANIIFDSFPEKTFTGAVDQINQTPQESSGVVSYLVSIYMNKGEEKIFSGMTAEIEVIISETEDVLLIPNSAIISQVDKKIVLLKTENGNPAMAEIETGETDGKNTEVIKGLNEGDIILEETLEANEEAGSSDSFGGPGGGGGMVPGAGAMHM